MPRLSPIAEYEQRLSRSPEGVHKKDSGAIENYQNQLGLQIRQYNPTISRALASDAESMRIKQLLDYSEEYPELKNMMGVAWTPDRQLNLEKAAYYANKTLGLEDVPIQADYRKRVDEEYEEERRRVQEVADRASWTGVAGKFAGIGHGSIVDPAYALGMLTGYGGATTALQTMVRVGLIEAGIETLATPFIMDFHEDIGSEYTASEAFVNVMAAGVLGGGTAGVGKWFQLRGELKYNKLFADLTPEQIEDSVFSWSTQLKDKMKLSPELEAQLRPIVHVLDNYPDQAAKAADVIDLDAARTVNSNVPYMNRKAPVNEDLTPEQVFANERESIDTLFAEAGEKIKGEKTEALVLLDEKGKEVYYKVGDKVDQIAMPEDTTNVRYAIHNHPDPTNISGFGFEDVNQTLLAGLTEARVINHDGTVFSFKVKDKKFFYKEYPDGDIVGHGRKIGTLVNKMKAKLDGLFFKHRRTQLSRQEIADLQMQAISEVIESKEYSKILEYKKLGKLETAKTIKEIPEQVFANERESIDTLFKAADDPDSLEAWRGTDEPKQKGAAELIPKEQKVHAEYLEIEDMDLKLEEIKELKARDC